jgi:hypothetical protein
MSATLKLEHRIGAVTLDRERVRAVTDGQRLRLEAATLRVAGEHAVEVPGPEAGLIATDAGADLDDHVLVVVGITLDHRQANLVLELLQPLIRAAQQLPELGVVAVLGQELTGTGCVIGNAAVFGGQLGRRLDVAVGARCGGEFHTVTDHSGIGELVLQLTEARQDLFDKLVKHRPPSVGTARRRAAWRALRPSLRLGLGR